MNETTIFSSLGIGGATLFIIWMIIRYFMLALDKKDEYLKSLIVTFQAHVELCNRNFIKSSSLVAKHSKRQAEAIDLLITKVQNADMAQHPNVNVNVKK